MDSPQVLALLPPEIKVMIWEAFCPYIKKNSQARVLHCKVTWRLSSSEPSDELLDYFNLIIPNDDKAEFGSGKWRASTGPYLKEHTYPVRFLATLCKETRELVLKRFPETIRIWDPDTRGQADIHFDARRDILLLEDPWLVDENDEGLGPLTEEPGCQAVRNLAVYHSSHTDQFFSPHLKFFGVGQAFPNLEQLYGCRDSHMLPREDLTWCRSPLVNKSHLRWMNTRKPQPCHIHDTVCACRKFYSGGTLFERVYVWFNIASSHDVEGVRDQVKDLFMKVCVAGNENFMRGVEERGLQYGMMIGFVRQSEMSRLNKAADDENQGEGASTES